MSQQDDFDNVDPVLPPPLDLSKWRKMPALLMGIGGVIAIIGAALDLKEFGYSWLRR
jgi:hypothetical protein